MRPSDKPLDKDWLKRARDAFLRDGVVADGIDPLIAASWKRCRPKLDPAATPRWMYAESGSGSRGSVQRSFLRLVARPIMEDIHEYIEGSSAALVLTDAACRVFETLGDVEMLELAETMGYRLGSFLDEGRVGTNAFALSLAEGVPVQVAGAEHYVAEYLGVYEAAAPIYDSSGGPIGAVGVVGPLTATLDRSLGIVVAAAKAIENRLLAEMFIRDADAQASEFYATLDAVSEGVLAWSANGVATHLNGRCGELLGVDPAVVVGRPLSEALRLPENVERAIAHGMEPSDIEAEFTVGGEPLFVWSSLRFVRGRDGQAKEFIATRRAPRRRTARLGPMTLRELEREAIVEALAASGGHIGEAASSLGIGRNTLHRKIVAYRIPT